MGPSSNNLVVLDFDNPLYFFEWEKLPESPSTYTVATSRGYHAYLFMTDPPLRTLRMRGGEIKGTGYVVAPPSLHPSGSRYVVHNDSPITTTTNLADIGISAIISTVLPTVREFKPIGKAPNLIADIHRALPIASLLSRYTQLSPSSADGRWLMGACVFHDDAKPSMWVDTLNDRCGCFVPACKAHEKYQDVINIYSHVTGISNAAAISELATMLCIT
jgi:hypothetical protein